MTTAFYPGSFDPLTNAILDVLIQALNVAERVVVGIGINPGKTPMFSFDERADLIRQSLAESAAKATRCLDVVAFRRPGHSCGAPSLGKAAVSAGCATEPISITKCSGRMNAQMAPDIQTVFCRRGLPRGPLRPIGSSDRGYGRDVRAFVPAAVLDALTRN